ncbi:MAG TPA: hypothetical protein VNO14_08055 [Blastocatellia bacterium]|nr:hypothetical protein [Blastocatellia bacterium]
MKLPHGAVGAKQAAPITLAEELEHQMAGIQGELKQMPQMPEKPWDPDELPPMPARPSLADFFKCGRLTSTAHGLQSAMRALKAGCKDETILACLVHDLGRDIRTTDHAYWGAQMLEPYVSAKISWAVRYHGVCRFFADPSVGYEYPEMYVHLFGKDFEPEPYLKQAYAYVRSHRWYMEARVIALLDDYSFQKGMSLDIDMFADVIGRNFKQPEEGLGWDNSPVAHMWRTLIYPTRPV